jgi:Na+/H+ antiporter NhaD/arsenite permease-like protein
MSGKWSCRLVRTICAAFTATLGAVLLGTAVVAHAATMGGDLSANMVETAVPVGVIGLLFATAGALALWRRRR